MTDQFGLQLGQKNDPPLAPVGPYHHGAGGIFNMPGTDLKLISALALPVTGALATLPVLNGGAGSSNEFGGEMIDSTNILTGITAGALEDFANQPTTECYNGPVGGLKKLCTVVNTYARYRGSTRELAMIPAGRRADYADLPLQALNNPLTQAGPFLSGLAPTLSTAIATDIQQRIFETMVSYIRFLARRVWIGTPANNNGEARDLWGLDNQINVNTHRDRWTANVCTAANSDVKNFGYALADGSVRDINAFIEMCDQYVYFNAQHEGLMPFDYDVYMHPNLWPTISSLWPIRQYQAFITQMVAANALGGGTGGFGEINLSDAYDLRSQFRSDLVLPINGRPHRVVLDEGITEQSPNDTPLLQAGQWASTIYGVPRTFLGGMPGTFFKFFQQDNAQARAIAQFVAQQGAGSMTFTTDGGLFRWFADFSKGCLKLNFDTGPSIHVVVPQLAWRIDNVAYAPLQHLRSAFPSSDYFADGGRTTGDTPNYYAGWSSTRQTLS